MKIKKNKIWFVFVVTVLTFLGFILFYKVKQQEKAQILKIYTEKVEQDIREIENNIKEIQRTIQYLSNNPVIQNILSNKYASDLRANNDMSENIEAHLWYLITRKNRSIDKLNIYSLDTNSSIGSFIQSKDKIFDKIWYEELIANKKNIIYKDMEYVYLVYPIFKLKYNKLLGAIEVRLDIDNVTDNIKITKDILGYKFFLKDEVIKGKITDLDTYEVLANIEEMDLSLLYNIRKISVLEGSFSLLLILLIAIFLIILISLQYNKFLEREHLHILEERKKRTYLKNMVLKAQISPHFLYNIISMINWKAKYSGQNDISEICIELSEFYRTALNKGLDEISLREELNNIESYIKLKQRLVEIPFSYEIICSKKQKEYKIINFILQPIVENAILHGIGALEEGGYIKIVVSENKSDIYIEIIDNGAGDIDIEKIFENKKGYGIRNVDERIKLHYGNEYGISLKRSEDETRFILRLKNNIENKVII